MQNAVTMRERQINIRLNEDEAARAEAVSAHYGLNAANLFRFLIKREVDQLGLKVGESRAPAKKSAKK